MIHRAILGSLERFMGILIENFAGGWAGGRAAGCQRRAQGLPCPTRCAFPLALPAARSSSPLLARALPRMQAPSRCGWRRCRSGWCR